VIPIIHLQLPPHAGCEQELIKVKAYQVAPSELEGHLLEHNDVADAAVIGVPDEFSGEIPFAFIVLKPQVASRVKNDRQLRKIVHESIFKVKSCVPNTFAAQRRCF
jgi:acyl-coenzyme A synthetase/AMP-(fatty) acid ligase